MCPSPCAAAAVSKRPATDIGAGEGDGEYCGEQAGEIADEGSGEEEDEIPVGDMEEITLKGSGKRAGEDFGKTVGDWS